MSEQQTVYFFAWFQPEEWQGLKEIEEVSESLDDSYQEWRQNAEHAIAELRADGVQVQKISIKTKGLLEWCEMKGLQANGSARSEYTALLAQQRVK